MGGPRSFLNGEFSNDGWWQYFPIVMAVKLPIMTTSLFIAALGDGHLGKRENLQEAGLCRDLAHHCSSFHLAGSCGRRRSQHRRPSYPANVRPLARMFHQFENEGDLGRPERFSESFDVDQVWVE